jgi:signal transduction histidine kinase
MVSSPGSVERLLGPLLAQVAAVLALLAGIALVGVGVSTMTVRHLVEELQPAAEANRAVLQDLTDMQTSVRAYALTGERVLLDDYRRAAAALTGHQRRTAAYADDHGDLSRLVASQEAATDAWVDLADQRLQRPGGPGTLDRELFRAAESRFEEVRAASARTVAAYDARVGETRDRARLWLQGTVVAALLATAAGVGVLVRAGRRLRRQVSDPLTALERVVHRMSERDGAVRAPELGPREVRAVARALNELAEAQERAREVERRVHDELRTLDTARDDFVSNVSHELRTPLTTISGYLELINDEFAGRVPARHQKMMDATRRNVGRLRLLIDDLLTLSRAESRATDLEQVDLAEVVADVVTDVRITAARREVRVDLGLPAGERFAVLGDRALLHRALLNVVGNAVKFSPGRSVVDVSVGAFDDTVLVVVRDRGIGIPAAELDQLGTRFFRASNAVADQIAGTGLGMRIVQTIVDKHAGDVLVESTEGVGTTVTVRLPRRGSGSEPEPATQQGAGLRR